MSFDMVSLFTSVPVNDALQSVATILSEDNIQSLANQTTIIGDDICSLMELLVGNFFQFEDQSL